METNETPGPFGPPPGISLNFEAQSYLKEAGKWAYFLGILGFIFCGLFLIFSFFAGSMFTHAAEFSPAPNPMVNALAGMGAGITVLYILIDVWYFFFSFYLYQFGHRIKRGITFSDNVQINEALRKLKSFFKLWGISTIVVMVIYALIIIIAIIVGVAMFHK